MPTAGNLVINLALNTVGITAGLASVKSQLDAFDAQVSGQTRAAQAAAAAQRVTQAQSSVAIAADRVNLANLRAAATTAAFADAQARLAVVTASAAASDEALASANARVRNSEVAMVAAQNQVRASTIALTESQVALEVAQKRAANPSAVRTNNMFPLVTAAATIAGLAVLKFGEDSVSAAGKFQYQMRLIQTQAGASSRELASMSEAVLKLAPTVQAGPEELAKGLYHVESVGYRGAKALDILRVAAQGAAVGNANLESVTNALVAAVATGIKGTEDYTQAMGILNATVGTGNLRMEDLAASLSSGVLATAKQFGLGLQDVGAALATMADQGIPAEEGATRLRITIALLGAPTKLAAAQLEKIGLSQRSLAEAMRSPDGLVGALTLLKTHLDETFGSDEIAKTNVLKAAFGGSRSSSGILTLTNSMDLLNQKLKQIGEGKDTFAARFAEESQTFEAASRNLGAAVDVLKVRLGNSILGPVTLLANVLGFLAQQTFVMIPLFTALTSVITIYAAVSTVKLLASMTKTVAGWLTGGIAARALGNVFRGLTVDTSLLASAQGMLAQTYAQITPVILGEADAMARNAAATAATMDAVRAGVPSIVAVGDAAMTAAAGVNGMTASLERGLYVMRQMPAASGALVVGVAGADGAIAAQAASTGALVVGTQTAAGAQERLAASTGPVITGLAAESVVTDEMTASMNALAIAQRNVAVQRDLAGATSLKASLTGLRAALTSGSMAAIGTAAGAVLGAAMGIAMEVAIVAAVTVGFLAVVNHIVNSGLDQMNDDFQKHIKQVADNSNLSQLQNQHDLIKGQLDKAKEGFHPIEDLLGLSGVSQLEGALTTVDAKIEEEQTHAGFSAGDGFATGLAGGLAGVTKVNQTLVQQFGATMGAVATAAGQLGGAAMTEYAKGLADARQAPQDAFKDLVTSLKTQMSPAQEVARLVGELSSQQLAAGLASGDTVVVAKAEATRKQIIERLDAITGDAYTAGAVAGTTWQDAFMNSLVAGGLDEATAAAKLADVLADPAKVQAATQKFAALQETWRRMAPTAAQAAAAMKDVFAGLADTTSVADQAKEFVAAFHDDLDGLRTIGEGAGADLMGAIAKGIKDQRDAPLNALKELHAAMKDQFSKNREVALLWAELQSKDIADGLGSGDSYIVAKTQETVALITGQLDYLTGGAYSRSLGAGAAVGAGLAASQGVVSAGAAQAVSGVDPVWSGVIARGSDVGVAAGSSVGVGLAASQGAVTSGAAVAVSGVGAIFEVVARVADSVGNTAGAAAARSLEAQAPAVLDGTVKMVAPAVAWLNSLGGVFAQIGQLLGVAFGASLTAGAASAVTNTGGAALGAASAAAIAAAQKTKSFADYLKEALGGAGDMAKYLKEQLNGVANTAASARAAMTTAFADIKAAAEEYFQTLHDKNLQAIQDAHDQKNAILDAKEALNQKPVSAAQKALDFQLQAQQEWRLRQAVANATDPAARRDAILALQNFLAQKHIDMMQDEVDAAKAEIDAQKKHNDDLLAQQKKAEDERYALQKKNFDRDLAALQRYLATHPGEWRKVQGEILALLGKFGVNYNLAGAALGQSFVAGLRSALGAAAQAAKDLATAGSTGVVPAAPPPAAPPPVTPPPAAPPPVPAPGGGVGAGGAPIPLASGAWQIMKDNLLAYLHQDEMVLPRDVAGLMRAVGGRPSPFRTLALGAGSPSVGSPSLGSADVTRGVSVGHGGGGTLIVKVGDQVLAEIVDRSLSIQDDIYGRPRVSTRSGR